LRIADCGLRIGYWLSERGRPRPRVVCFDKSASDGGPIFRHSPTMRSALAAIAMVCCVSCATYEPPDLTDAKRFVPIPQSAVSDAQGVGWQQEVHWQDGISKDEAVEVSDVFWHKFIRNCGSCGLADIPSNRSEFWRVELTYGADMASHDGGNLWSLKNGSGIYYEPPRTGICAYAREALARSGVEIESIPFRPKQHPLV
jgi:hypothetical protein